MKHPRFLDGLTAGQVSAFPDPDFAVERDAINEQVFSDAVLELDRADFVVSIPFNANDRFGIAPGFGSGEQGADEAACQSASGKGCAYRGNQVAGGHALTPRPQGEAA